MQKHLKRGIRVIVGRFLVAVVVLQHFAFVIPVANAEEQSSYRWRNDDGNETTATWAAAENAPATVLRGTPERLRFSAKHEVADGDVMTSVRLDSGDDAYYSSALDGTDLYVGTAESPARLLKFDTTTGPPYSAPSTISLATGENNVYTTLLDTANDRGYFITSTVPTKIIKVQLSTFTRLTTLTLNSGEDYGAGGVIVDGYLYLLTRTNPGNIVKVDLATFTETYTLPIASDLVYSVASPVVNDDKLYLAVGNNDVEKYDISSPTTTDPSYVTSLPIPMPSAPYNAAIYMSAYGLAVDSVNDKLYATNYYGLLHKIDIAGGSTFSYVDYLPLGISTLSGIMAVDLAVGKLYVAAFNPWLSKVDLATFTEDANTVALSYQNLNSLQISGDGSTLFALAWSTPAHMMEIATGSLVSTVVYDGATFGSGYVYSSVVDPTTNIGYFGTAGNDQVRGDIIIKMDLATMTQLGRIELPDGYQSLGAAAIDVADGYAYFIDYNSPSHLIRVDLSSFTWDELVLPADGPYYYHYTSMAIDTDPSHHYLYLGSYGVPSVVTQIDLDTFTRGSTLELSSSPMEDRLSSSLAIDTVHDKLYAGAGSTAGRVIRINVAGSSLTREAAIQTPGNAFSTGMAVDETAGFLYVLTSNINVLKITIANGTAFSIVGSVTLGGPDDYANSAVIDTTNGMLYFGGGSTPGKVFRINTSAFGSYDADDDIIAPDGEEFVYSVAVDSTNGNVYFGSYQMPTLITKVTGNPKKQLRLEYAPKTGTCAASSYAPVANGNDWTPKLSSNVVSGTATTNVAGGLTDSATVFKSGYFMSSGAQAPAIQINTDQFTELEYSIMAASGAAPGEYCFRLTDAGSPFATYTNYAEATLKTNDVTLNNAGTLSSLAVNATSTVTVAFTLQNDFPTGTLTVTFPNEFTSITAPTASLGTCTLNAFGAFGQTMTAEKSGCVAGDTVILTGGTVVNPATPGLYTISWTNDDPGYAIVAIVDSDQVTVNANVSPTITFDLNTNFDNSADAAPYSVPFGSLLPGTVKSSDNVAVNSIWANLTTNATSGAVVSVLSANAALKSTSAPSDVIPNSAATMTSGTANYGLCVNSVTAGDGILVRDTNYAALTTCIAGGTANDVAALSTVSPDPILNSSNNPIDTAVAEILVNANADTSTAAHSDYTDTLTFVATGTF